ncbi:MAG TPA: ABC transporter ATP-binding protein [Streptomyces sp.]
MTRSGARRPGGTRAGDGRVRRLTGYCLRHRPLLVLAFAGAALTAVTATAVPYLVRRVVDSALDSGGAGGAGPQTVALVALALAQYGIGLASRYCAGRLSLDVAHDLRADALAALLRLDGRGRARLDTGQRISRTISDMSLVQGLLVTVPALFSNGLLFLLSLTVMTVLSPALAVLAAFMGLALWYAGDRSRRDLFPASWSAQQCAGEVVATAEAAVTGVRVVKGFGQEDRELSRLRDGARRLFAERMRVVRLQSRWSPLLQTLPALGQVGVLLLGGLFALDGRITLGTFLAFSAYLAQLVGPARRLTAMLTMVQRAGAGLERVLELVDENPAVTDPESPQALPAGPLSVEFREVRFEHGEGPPVLAGLSFRLAAGETVALVGPTGSGKSTLAALLARFHDPVAGTVSVGGVDVRRTSLDELRTRVAVAFEDSFLFAGTIRDNIAFACPGADERLVHEAARTAEADEFIRALPEGYDTVVGERGLTLSGGQRQRIALARALLPQPSVLVLDDATSALDGPTGARVNAALRSGAGSRTTLVIAHRRSTLEIADRVVVIDEGRVVDSGPLAELERTSAPFRCLFHDAARQAPMSPPVQAEQPGIVAPSATSTGPGPATSRERDMAGRVAALPTATDTPHLPDDLVCAAAPHLTLAELLRPVRGPLLLGAGLIGLETLTQLVLPMLVSTGVDQGVVAGSRTVLVAASATALVAVGLAWTTDRRGLLVTGRNGERLLYLLRVRAFAHLQRLGLDFYERVPGGRIMTLMTTDVDAFADFLQAGLPMALVSVFTLLGVLVALVALAPALSLPLLAVLPLALLATRLFQRYAMPAYAVARERIGALNAQLYENVMGLPVIQLCRRGPSRHALHLSASRAYRDARLHAHLRISAYFQTIQLLTDAARVLILLLGAARLADGRLSAGVLIAFFLYVDAFFAPVQQLSQVLDGYRQASVGLERLRELLATPVSTPQPTHPVAVRRLAGEVRFRGVWFSYPSLETPVLADVDLVVRPGETVALVGSTGAGKSTLMKLAARFHDPTSGAVLVDGTDLRSMDLSAYRARLGVVPQEPYLLAGSVRDAIAYGRPDAGDAEVEAAARAVGAHAVISALPGGYRHRIDERGRNLSAGQAQLVALARAELVAPDLLLLDEATASLGPAAEAVVATASARLSRRRTTLVVAHSLTTAARADRIVVLEAGRVVETGRHEALVAADGPYAKLWAAHQTGEEGGSWGSSPVPVP